MKYEYFSNYFHYLSAFPFWTIWLNIHWCILSLSHIIELLIYKLANIRQVSKNIYMERGRSWVLNFFWSSLFLFPNHGANLMTSQEFKIERIRFWTLRMVLTFEKQKLVNLKSLYNVFCNAISFCFNWWTSSNLRKKR